jgi:hypothetical protein
MAQVFIICFQQDVVTKSTSSSLFLTAVRVIIERGDLKGGLQEVHVFPKDGDEPGRKKAPCLPQKIPVRTRKTPLLPKRHQFMPKSLPCGNKKAIKPNFQPDPGDY